MDKLFQHIENDKVLDGRYVIKSRIGSGYSSEVYLAEQPDLQQDRAIKIMHKKHLNEQDVVDQLLKEAIRQSGLTHRNIVKIIDVGKICGCPAIVQEYVDGGNLKTWLAEDGVEKTKENILSLLDDILSALAYMHEKKMMHMDVKPENILVSSDGGFRLADFGVAKGIAGNTDTIIAGTHRYMHTELHGVKVLPRNKLKFKYDCYSVGKLIELDLLPAFRKTAEKDDVRILEYIAQKAVSTDSGYSDIVQMQKHLDKLNNRFLPATSVDEFSLRASFGSSIRIAPEINVPFTDRVLNIVESAWFQRLRRVRQLGPITLVYPGANHTRFEHSLGTFHCARKYLDVLLRQREFRWIIDDDRDVSAVLAAALLHDIGHYPFAHPIEEAERRFKASKKGQGMPMMSHEKLARMIITGDGMPESVVKKVGEKPFLAEQLHDEWDVDPEMVCRLIAGKSAAINEKEELLSTIISGPIDADKMDYLERDSVHLGVPYGKYIDKERFFSSLTTNQSATDICLTDKGRVAAETFIFSRYTMTSEVYWHHTVRGASAMVIQAMEHCLRENIIGGTELLCLLLECNDEELLEKLAKKARGMESGNEPAELLTSICKKKRSIYKRLATYSSVYKEKHKKNTYNNISELETSELRQFQNELNKKVITLIGSDEDEGRSHVLVDVPPKDQDVYDDISIYYPSTREDEQQYYELGELSEIAAGLGTHFQRSVKKIRIFGSQNVSELMSSKDTTIDELVRSCLIKK